MENENDSAPHSQLTARVIVGIYSELPLPSGEIDSDILVDLASTTWQPHLPIGQSVQKILGKILESADVTSITCLHKIGDGAHVNPGVAVAIPKALALRDEQQKMIVAAVVTFLQRVSRGWKVDTKTQDWVQGTLDDDLMTFVDNEKTVFLADFGGGPISQQLRIEIFGQVVGRIPVGKLAAKPKADVEAGDEFDIECTFRMLDVDARSIGLRQESERGRLSVNFDEENYLQVLRPKLGNGRKYRVFIKPEVNASGKIINVIRKIDPLENNNRDLLDNS